MSDHSRDKDRANAFTVPHSHRLGRMCSPPVLKLLTRFKTINRRLSRTRPCGLTKGQRPDGPRLLRSVAPHDGAESVSAGWERDYSDSPASAPSNSSERKGRFLLRLAFNVDAARATSSNGYSGEIGLNETVD